MKASISFQGAAALREQMRRLPAAMQTQALLPALLTAARLIARAVRKRAPRGKKGNLKRGVTARTPRAAGVDHMTAEVGFRRGLGRAAHLVEKGTGARFTNAGAYRGRMPPRPFFGPAVAETTQAAFTALRVRWAARLAIAARALKTGIRFR